MVVNFMIRHILVDDVFSCWCLQIVYLGICILHRVHMYHMLRRTNWSSCSN